MSDAAYAEYLKNLVALKILLNAAHKAISEVTSSGEGAILDGGISNSQGKKIREHSRELEKIAFKIKEVIT